jgi:hypothetical protein
VPSCSRKTSSNRITSACARGLDGAGGPPGSRTRPDRSRLWVLIAQLQCCAAGDQGHKGRLVPVARRCAMTRWRHDAGTVRRGQAGRRAGGQASKRASDERARARVGACMCVERDRRRFCWTTPRRESGLGGCDSASWAAIRHFWWEGGALLGSCEVVRVCAPPPVRCTCARSSLGQKAGSIFFCCTVARTWDHRCRYTHCWLCGLEPPKAGNNPRMSRWRYQTTMPCGIACAWMRFSTPQVLEACPLIVHDTGTHPFRNARCPSTDFAVSSCKLINTLHVRGCMRFV